MRKHLPAFVCSAPACPSPQQYLESSLHCKEMPFSPSLRKAVDSEARLRSSRGFDEQFWAQLEERRARNATWKGRFQQILEVELSGIAVWRVLGSGVLGAALPALVLVCCTIGSSSSPVAPPLSPVLWTITPWNQRRFWEEMAWKNPTRPVLVSLLDPNWKGGKQCEFRFAV
ncbi:MAG: hypothetical protein EOO38_24705 [Cytophagaceae bacterium]|nr:MAG: hypothetical protein EOO38_24705 [Cytophagaceae bacterium]